MQATERLWLNAKKSKLLPEGHPKAASLYAAVGDEIPEESAQRFGLEDGGLPVKKAATKAPEGEGKQGGKGENKEAAKGGNKQGAKGGDKSGGPGSPSGAGLTINKKKKE